MDDDQLLEDDREVLQVQGCGVEKHAPILFGPARGPRGRGAKSAASAPRPCGGDEALRHEIESLLADANAADAFLSTPAGERLPDLVSTVRPASQRRAMTPGTTLGDYQVERLLGRGGMGAVFLAHDARLHRRVALKVLDGCEDEPSSRSRLLREARNAAALTHPHICTVYEAGEAAGTPFIAMEFVDGRSLREIIDARAAEGSLGLPVAEVVRYGIQAADALAHAHAHSVIHRDFKAANVIVGSDGRLKIVDFGLARRGDALAVAGTTMSSLVPTGIAAGTPYAMAPEQVRGEPADPRTDVWALGILLYEMATGVAPFEGATVGELFSSVLTSAPAPLPDEIPVALRALIERCLEKDPSRRYEDAGPVRAGLEVIQADSVSPWFAWRYRLRRQRRFTAAAALLLAASVLAAANVGGLRDRLLGNSPVAASLRLAVLPLEDLSGDTDQEYFASGVHDALITDLAAIDALRVTARPSTLRYRATQKSIGEIARELNIDAVVTGSVARSGDRVRVTAQLIDAATEEHVWTARYDRTVHEVLSLQNEIVAAIARAVRLQLTPDEEAQLARTRPVDPEAHEAYLRGMFFLNQATPEAVKRGLGLLNEAIAKDPAHPLPYAHLAAGYATLGHGPAPPPGAFEQARAAAVRALELDDSVALAHAVLAELILYAERSWDWPAAERAFQRAIELNPTLARAHAHYAWYLLLFSRWEEAVASMRRAQEVDPLTPLWPAWQSYIYAAMDRREEALREAQKAVELNPNFPIGLHALSVVHSIEGRHGEAIALVTKAAGLAPRLRADAGSAYALAGRTDEAWRIAAELAQSGDDPFGIAMIYAALGVDDDMFSWLEAAYAARSNFLPWIGYYYPETKRYRDDPRFADLLRRMKLLR